MNNAQVNQMFDKCRMATTLRITDEDLQKGNFQEFLFKYKYILDREPMVKFVRDSKKPTTLADLKNLDKKAKTHSYTYEGHRLDTVTSLTSEEDKRKMSVNNFIKRKDIKKKGTDKDKEEEIEREKERDIELLKARELLTEKILMVILSRPFFTEARENHEFKYIIDHDAELINLVEEGILWDLEEECGLEKGMSGISSLWNQVGELFSMAPYHQEDCNNRSFNYMICGEPKLWFAVHNDDIPKVEELLRSHKDESETCNSYFRHKSHWVHPQWLIDNNIQVYCCLQQPGEMMITSSTHWILNLGMNINISMNFIMKVVEEIRRWNSKNGSYCDDKCENKEHSYTYPHLALKGWTVKCTCCGERDSWCDEGMRDHIILHCPNSPYKKKYGLTKKGWKDNVHPSESIRKLILKDYIKYIPECEFCDSKKVKCIQRHWLVHHKDLHPEERCNICRKVFAKPSSLKHHIKTSKKCSSQ